MAVWEWLLDSAGFLLLVVFAYGATLVLRRRVISRDGGTFELSVRTSTRSPGRGWVLGLGRYDSESLQWFRIFSPWPRPKQEFLRADLTVLEQREPSGSESFSLYAGSRVVRCQVGEREVELAMSPGSLTGFQSWLEAAPPGDPAPDS